MTMNNLPPQAYTRETVAEAFEWMKSQSPSTRDLAKDANTLVSLYLNAKRHKRIKNMKPEDTVNFQNELKDLAKGIQQFNQEAPTPQNNITTPPNPVLTPDDLTQPKPQTPDISLKNEFVGLNQTVTLPKTEFINPQDILSKSQSTSLSLPSLKPATQELISKTRAKLNLSSDEDALNALVAMGFEKIKAIFKL